MNLDDAWLKILLLGVEKLAGNQQFFFLLMFGSDAVTVTFKLKQKTAPVDISWSKKEGKKKYKQCKTK